MQPKKNKIEKGIIRFWKNVYECTSKAVSKFVSYSLHLAAFTASSYSPLDEKKSKGYSFFLFQQIDVFLCVDIFSILLFFIRAFH